MQSGNYKTVLQLMMHCSSCIPETMRGEDLCKFLRSCLRMEFLLGVLLLLIGFPGPEYEANRYKI